MAYAARVLLDSISEAGIRLTTLEVTFPRFVLAEFNTHRSFCLAAETRLYFDLPAGRKKRSTRRFTMTLQDLHEKWHRGAAARQNRPRTKGCEGIDPDRFYTARELAIAAGYADYTGIDLLTRRAGIPRVTSPGVPYRVRGADYIAWVKSEASNRQPLRDRLAAMYVRSCNEDTGEIEHTHIRDVTYSGEQPVFRVTLAGSQQIVASAKHRFLTDEGWQTLEDATGLSLSSGGIAVWEKAPKFAVNGVLAYKDPQWLQARRDEGLSARRIAELAGVSLDVIKHSFQRHGTRFSNPNGVWRGSHVVPPWNKGRRYCNLRTRGVPSMARVRKGAESHLWRGGITPERAAIGAWTVHQAFRTHRANGFRCVLCGSGRRLHTHHLDPVAHNPSRAKDPSNLTSLCDACHVELHSRNLALALLEHVQQGNCSRDFWTAVGNRVVPRAPYTLPRRTMVRHYVPLRSIEFVGLRDTYDVEVQGPFHNFVANGIVVHNSRNSASSRAIPTAKIIARVEDDPVTPLEWGRNQKGMSAREQLVPEEQAEAERAWLDARDAVLEQAQKLHHLGVHKQIANRLLEPFLWHTVIVTATEWDNFFELRCSPSAQPEIRQAAVLMRDAMAASAPGPVPFGAWHLPLIQEDERTLDVETLKKVSVARCARVSYLTHEGKREIEKDLELYERLKVDRHLSPFEHVATPLEDNLFHANVRGWRQMRQEIESTH